MIVAGAALWGMLGVTFAEVVARSVFQRSLGLSDEIGGYFLIALTFFSLPACHARKVFHQVEFILARLTDRQRLRLELAFDVACLACTSVLVWQCARLTGNTWQSGETSQNGLDIPVWLPQSLMVIGLAGLVWALARTFFAGLKALRAREFT